MSIVFCDPHEAKPIPGRPVLDTHAASRVAISLGHHLPVCKVAWLRVDATATTLQEFSLQLAILLHRRRGMENSERKAMKERLGGFFSAQGASIYGVLKHTLHEASNDEAFRALARQPNALWLEFGTYRGRSANITSKFIQVLHKRESVPLAPIVGFDTFTGLPEAWNVNGHAKNAYSRGHFSLQGKLPPVRHGVRLVQGLFNETLPRYLATEVPANAPLAWVNVDCDLYDGARTALRHLQPRIREGSRLHFHELLYGHRWQTIADKGQSIPRYPLSDEAKALYEWLRAHPDTLLELRPVKSVMNQQAVAFVVRAAHRSRANV